MTPFTGEWLWHRARSYGWAGVVCATVLTLWWEWETIRARPGVSAVVEWVTQKPIPHAGTTRFSVCVAHFQNDDSERTAERFVVDTLANVRGMEILSIDRTLSAEGPKPQVAIEQAHALARRVLQESEANVLLWGEVIAGRPRIFFTPAQEDVHVQTAKYQDLEKLEVPALTGGALAETLRLVIVKLGEDLRLRQGHFVELDELEPFIEKIENLLRDDALSSAWPATVRANVRVILGDALMTLAKQTGDDMHLEKAVSLFQVASAEFNSAGELPAWADARNRLGNSLSTLGGRRCDSERMQLAVHAYEEAQTVWDRDRDPDSWAVAEVNIANALRLIGQCRSDPDSIAAAIGGHETAAQLLNADNQPFCHVANHVNRGIALEVLGELQADPALVEEAIVHYRDVLNTIKRAQNPMFWAEVEHNLGSGLLTLGEATSDPAHIRAAVDALHLALEERTRTHSPREWALSHVLLGDAFRALATASGGTEYLKKSIASYESALSELKKHDSRDWAETQRRLCIGRCQGSCRLSSNHAAMS